MSEFEAERLARAKALFDRPIGTGSQRAKWAVATDLPMRDFTQHAYYADLLVLGQRDPKDASQTDVPADFVESVVIESGKPALVVPYIGASGHTRVRELVLGGATRMVLNSLTVPVLMAH